MMIASCTQMWIITTRNHFRSILCIVSLSVPPLRWKFEVNRCILKLNHWAYVPLFWRRQESNLIESERTRHTWTPQQSIMYISYDFSYRPSALRKWVSYGMFVLWCCFGCDVVSVVMLFRGQQAHVRRLFARTNISTIYTHCHHATIRQQPRKSAPRPCWKMVYNVKEINDITPSQQQKDDTWTARVSDKALRTSKHKTVHIATIPFICMVVRETWVASSSTYRFYMEYTARSYP